MRIVSVATLGLCALALLFGCGESRSPLLKIAAGTDEPNIQHFSKWTDCLQRIRNAEQSLKTLFSSFDVRVSDIQGCMAREIWLGKRPLERSTQFIAFAKQASFNLPQPALSAERIKNLLIEADSRARLGTVVHEEELALKLAGDTKEKLFRITSHGVTVGLFSRMPFVHRGDLYLVFVGVYGRRVEEWFARLVIQESLEKLFKSQNVGIALGP